MCERLPALFVTFALIVTPAVGESETPLEILDLPFKVEEFRGPDGEVALAVATSGVLPIARPNSSKLDPKAATPESGSAPIAVVWGKGGGAVLSLDGTRMVTTLLGSEAVAGFAEAERPRTAVPGSRRAVSGPVSAYFTGPIGSAGRAAGLTIRERQPLGVTAEPKAVPIATTTVTPGADMVFIAGKPRLAAFDGKPVVLAATARSDGASSLAVVSKRVDNWHIDARSASKPSSGTNDGPPLAIAAVSDFLGTGRPQIAVLRSHDGGAALELWGFSNGTLALAAEASGYAAPMSPDSPVLAAVVPTDRTGHAKLAIATGDRTALAILSFDGRLRERTRIALPAPAATGVGVLGRGVDARIVVGLADGRVAYFGARGERR